MDNGKYNHYEYCENIARKHKAIQHRDDKIRFFRATEQDELSEVAERLSAASETLLLAINGVESSFGWSNSDSLMEQPLYSFAVVSQTRSDDSASIHTAQQECYLIAKQIIARMMNDYHDQVYGMDLLEPDSFQMKGFGPVGDNFYGVLVSFFFNQGVNYEIDPEIWAQ